MSIFRHCKHTILFPYHKIYFVKSFGRKAPPPRGGTVVERRSRKLPESFWASNVEVGGSQKRFGARTSKSEAARNVLGLERRSRKLPESFWGSNVEVGGSQNHFGARTSKSEAPKRHYESFFSHLRHIHTILKKKLRYLDIFSWQFIY